MAFPDGLESLNGLFNSRGAQMYWENWYKIKTWYGTYMLPEMMKSQTEICRECCVNGKKRKKRKHRENKKKTAEVWNRSMPIEQEVEEYNEESTENNVEDMTPEFLEFYQKTLKHRNELKKFKEEQSALEEMVEYIADDQGPEGRPKPTTAPPTKQAGIDRVQNLEMLYGSSANKIHVLETRMQAKFDEIRTKRQPKFWPVIPLNL